MSDRSAERKAEATTVAAEVVTHDPGCPLEQDGPCICGEHGHAAALIERALAAAEDAAATLLEGRLLDAEEALRACALERGQWKHNARVLTNALDAERQSRTLARALKSKP